MEHHLVSYPAVVKEVAGKTHVEFPDLPDANVVDDNHYQALVRAQIGLAIIIIDLETHHEPVPEPSNVTEIADQYQGEGISVQLITTDLDEY